MRSILAPLLGSLLVLCVLFELVSEDRGSSGGSGSTHATRMVDAGDSLIQAIMLRRPRRLDYALHIDKIAKTQQALKAWGFYSGPVDGAMSPTMNEALRSFQQSRHLNVTGTIDDDTARELGF